MSDGVGVVLTGAEFLRAERRNKMKIVDQQTREKETAEAVAELLAISRQFADAAQAAGAGRYHNARRIIYDVDRFDTPKILSKLTSLEFDACADPIRPPA